MNAKLLDGIMAGHKLYIETGTIVNEKTKLDLSQVKKMVLNRPFKDISHCKCRPEHGRYG